MKTETTGRVCSTTSITKRNIELAFIDDSDYHKARIKEFGRINLETLISLGAVVPKRPGSKRKRRARRWHPVAIAA